MNFESMKGSQMRKLIFVLVVLCAFIVAACDPYSYVGDQSATATTPGSGTGGYCGPAQGVASK